jgi:signal transduction histidine kinase
MALTFLLLFGGASALMLGGVYLLTAHFMRVQLDLAIGEDLTLLSNTARERGPRGLAIQVVRQARLAGENQAVFLYTDANGTPIAGNLTEWPDAVPFQGRTVVPRDKLSLTEVTATLPERRDRPDHDTRDHGTGDHDMGNHDGGNGASPGAEWTRPGPPPGFPMGLGRTPPFPPDARTGDTRMAPPPWKPGAVRLVTLTLPDGDRLLVGRDTGAVDALLKRLTVAMRLGLLVTILLALLGAWVTSRRFARRLAGVAQASHEIMAGDLSRRVPQGRGADGDDFDQLAATLNTMLARIESLMAGVRHVSDTIAHDLRTPLARLRNRLEALQSDATESLDREGLSQALREVDGLLATFNALLRIAQVETGGRRMAFAPVDLAALLADVVDLYDAVAEESGVTLDTAIATAATVDGDRDLLFQAFANLMDNAVKFSPDGGVVGLALAVEGEDAVITLTDHGPGIPEGDRERVFERFARLDQSRTTPGNGLGLTMVAAVTEAHGGAIRLDDGPGGGLRVTLRLRLRRAGSITPP